MTKDYKIENITFSLYDENNKVVVKSPEKSVSLFNQSIDNVSKLIDNNLKIVSGHYKLMVSNVRQEFEISDIFRLSFSIVIHYLYMYNLWRNTYKKQENKDLTFDVKDFDNPSTHDIIFNYYKSKYPTDWETKSAALIGITIDELKAYYKNRQNFYNK